MEYTLKTDLEIGQPLYYLESKDKTIYAPCVACNNERKVKVSAGGEDFTVDCPKCTGRATKGDTSRSISIKVYTVETTQISAFVFGYDNYDRNEKWRVSHSGYAKFDPETLQDEYSKQYYIDQADAKKTAAALNKAEKAKGDEFLKGLER